MEKKLNSLFDFQRFQQNPKLKRIIWHAESSYADALDDDSLDLVSAAGTTDIPTVEVGILLGRHDTSDNEEKNTW